MREGSRRPILPAARGVLASLLPGLGLLAVVVVTWGIFVGRTGFYWDDWPVLWIFDELGASGLDTFFSADRPLYKVVYQILMPVYGTNPAAWLATLLAFLWLTGWMWYAVLVDLWPRQRALAWMAAAFAVVYPGFTDNVIAFSYVQHYISSAAYLLSLRLSIAAVRASGARAVVHTIGAVAATLVSFLLVEYYVGLELVRGFVLLVALDAEGSMREQVMRTWRRVVAVWAPTLGVLVSFVLYQFQTASYESADYRHAATLAGEVSESPVTALLGKALLVGQNLLSATLLSWARPIEPRLIDFQWGFSVLASWVALVAVAFVVVLVALWRGFHRQTDVQGDARGDHRQMLVVALLLLVACGLPMAFADLRIKFDWESRDRFSIPFLFGSSLLLLTLVRMVARTRGRALVVGALAIGLAASFQFREANSLRLQWTEHRDLFWQFAWRFPHLQPGTSVLIEGMPIMISDNLAASNLNLLYGPGPEVGDLDYYFFDLRRERTYRSYVPLPAPGQPTGGDMRMFRFDGTTSQALVVDVPEEGSIRFVDPRHVDEIPRLSPAARRVAAMSSPRRALGPIDATSIDALDEPPGPLLSIFGPRPYRGWSYHFQRAELARQLELWDDVVALEVEAREKRLRPARADEWAPFLEARLQRGEVDEAARLTRHALEQDAYALAAMSAVWRHAGRDGPDALDSLRNVDAELAVHLGALAGPADQLRRGRGRERRDERRRSSGGRG